MINIGARQLKRLWAGVGFATSSRVQSEDEANKAVIEKLKENFSPEFWIRSTMSSSSILLQRKIFSRSSIFDEGCHERLSNLASRWNWPRMQNHSLLIRVMMSVGARLFTGLFKNILKIFGWGEYWVFTWNGDVFAGWSDKENQKLKFSFRKVEEKSRKHNRTN